MTTLSLMVGVSYRMADGDIITITRDLRTDHGHIGKDRFAIENGYVFLADNGDSYLPDGRFDKDEATSLDLVAAVEKEYIIGYDWNSFTGTDYEIVKALNPVDAIRTFRRGSAAKPVSVYEAKNVTPSNFEELLSQLVIKVGGSYRTRQGSINEITSELDKDTQMYHQGYRFVGGPCGQYYTVDGKTYLDGTDNPGDLVEDVT